MSKSKIRTHTDSRLKFAPFRQTALFERQRVPDGGWLAPLHSASIINRDRSVADSPTFTLCCCKQDRVALPPLHSPLIKHEPKKPRPFLAGAFFN